MWLKGNERTLHHFTKHGGGLEKCINVISKHNWITECSEYAQNYISGVRYYSNEICMLYFIILLSDPVDRGSWHFAADSCGSCNLNIHFVLRSCRSSNFKDCSVLRSWRSWILHFHFIVGSWRSWILTFLIAVGSWRSWILIFVIAVGSWRSWILNFSFVMRSWRSWILTEWFCRGIF